jgi:glycosyltransferase involved in cell wall biosynthesis
LITSTIKPLPVLFVISNLSFAGTQRQLLTLIKHLDRDKFAPEVCTLSAQGEMEPEIEKLGIPLWHVLKTNRFDPWIFVRFAALCRRRKIQVIYSFLDFDNLVGRVGGRLARVPAIIASDRSTNYTLPGIKKYLERWTLRLSNIIITNSSAGRDFLIRDKKIAPDVIRVIHNSLDPGLLKCKTPPGEVRTKFSIPADAIVVGIAARRRPEKNFGLFFSVAEEITCRDPQVWFLHVGDAAPTYQEYNDWIETRHKELTHRNRVILAGHWSDMGAFYRDIDILMITSDREGFSNVLMEAMAMGIPAVATDVGDNHRLLADQGGFTSPPGNVDAMISNLLKLTSNRDLRLRMGEYNRRKSMDLFSVERMVTETGNTILEIYRSKAKVDSKEVPKDIIIH